MVGLLLLLLLVVVVQDGEVHSATAAARYIRVGAFVCVPGGCAFLISLRFVVLWLGIFALVFLSFVCA